MPKSGVTMRDVAKAAGVSTMTVSRALRPDSPISEETRRHILQVVNKLNYVPDQMAGSLSSKRSGFVAVLVPSLNNLHFADTVQALTDELETHGLQILLGHTGYSKKREEQLVETMLRRRPEAMVLSYDGHTARSVDLLKSAEIPVVELWERPEKPIDHTIGISNEQAAFDMTNKLISMGYKRIAFLCESGDDWTRGASRRRGFVKAMQMADLPHERVIQIGKPPLSIEDGASALPVLRREYPDADCVFCVSDQPAFGLLSALQGAGVSVPEEIGVVGFGNFEVSRFSSPALSTVAVDPRRIGVAAGELIGRILSRPTVLVDQTQVNVKVELCLRGSTRIQ